MLCNITDGEDSLRKDWAIRLWEFQGGYFCKNALCALQGKSARRICQPHLYRHMMILHLYHTLDK